jgi:hypothetical protein
MLNFVLQFSKNKFLLGKKYRFLILSIVTAIQIMLLEIASQARDPRNFVSNFFDDLFNMIWSVIGPWVMGGLFIGVVWCLFCVVATSADTPHKSSKLPPLAPHIQKQLNAIDADSTLSAETKKEQKVKILEDHLEEEKRKLQTITMQAEQKREQEKKKLKMEIAELEGKIEIEEIKERHQEQLGLITKIERERIQRENKIRDFRNRTGREPNSWEI